MKKIVILHGEIDPNAGSDEQDTLVQVSNVQKCLIKNDFKVEVLQVGLDFEALLSKIENKKPDLLFNLVETLDGKMSLTHLPATILSDAGYKLTGCSGRALYLTTDKCLAKQLCVASNIETPAWFSDTSIFRTLSLPSKVIIKSATEDGSIGLDRNSVRFISSEGELSKGILEYESKFGGTWFAEEFIDGREFNIGILGPNKNPQVLPIAEIDFTNFPTNQPKIVGYRAKWDESSPEFLGSNPSFESCLKDTFLRAKLSEVATTCWKSFGLAGYARVDIRLDSQETPFVIEINANPCISPGAGFIKAAAKAGLEYDRVILEIIEAAQK